MATQPSSEEKMHYDSLITLFKYILGWLLGLASLVVAVAAFFISSNIKDIKKDIQEDVAKLKPDIEKIGKEADKTLADTKESSKLSLEYTKTLSEMQIKLLAFETAGAAKLEVKNEVEKAFKNNNVQFMIDQTARKEVGDNLKRIVKEETDKTREIFSYMSKIQILYERIGMQQQDVVALYELDSLSNYCDNESIKKLSKELLIQRGKDFDRVFNFLSPSTNTPVADSEEDFIQRLGLSTTSTTNEIARKLVYEIKQRPQLNMLTRYYLLLRRKTGMDFKTFDSKPVYDWYNSNYRNN
jgi:hypothetical protein